MSKVIEEKIRWVTFVSRNWCGAEKACVVHLAERADSVLIEWRTACGHTFRRPGREPLPYEREHSRCKRCERSAKRPVHVGDRVRVTSQAPCWKGQEWRGVIVKVVPSNQIPRPDGKPRYFANIDGLTIVLPREDFEVLR